MTTLEPLLTEKKNMTAGVTRYHLGFRFFLNWRWRH